MGSKNRVLAVHQPNFIPWIGYFDKIARCDIFVILDMVQIPRGTSVANRNQIKTANGINPLVVPISHAKGSDRISTYREVVLSDINWHKKPLKSITHAYSKAPHFNEVFPLIESAFTKPTLFEMNSSFILSVVKGLELKTELVFQSDLSGNEFRNNEMIISMCTHLNATTYLSGAGARSYNDPEMYAQHNVELSYQAFVPAPYPQLHGDFVQNLSMIDCLFNIGFEGARKLLETQN